VQFCGRCLGVRLWVRYRGGGGGRIWIVRAEKASFSSSSVGMFFWSRLVHVVRVRRLRKEESIEVYTIWLLCRCKGRGGYCNHYGVA